MATIDLTRLKAPFAPEDLEWRVQSAGEKDGRIWARVLCYVTARAVMDRLDEVFGPAGWQDDYRQGPAGGVLAGIGARIGDEWVWKWDGAENTDIEAVKGGLSGALKRAAVKWGVGRYLYRLGEAFAVVHDGGAHRAKTKDGKWFRWDPPALPAWALPDSAVGRNQEPKVAAATNEQLDRISALLDERDIPADKRERTLAEVAAGITAERAAKCITWLESLPMKDRAT